MRKDLAGLRRLSPLIIWYAFTFYTLYKSIFSEYVLGGEYDMLGDKHYISFVLLGIATLAQLFKYPTGIAVTLLALIIGIFASASFLPAVAYWALFSFKFSPYFLLLLIFFCIVNRKELLDALHLLGFGPEKKGS